MNCGRPGHFGLFFSNFDLKKKYRFDQSAVCDDEHIGS